MEFALVMIPLITLLLGTLEFGFYFFTAQSASSAARETARRLTVGECQATGAAQIFAQNQANVIALTLQYGTPSGASAVSPIGILPTPGSPLRVRVQADAKLINLFPLPNGGL